MFGAASVHGVLICEHFERKSTAGAIWPAADVSIEFWKRSSVLSDTTATGDFSDTAALEHGVDFAGKSVLELGAGTGVVGLWLAMQGAKVLMTDQAIALPLLRKNLYTNLEMCASRGQDLCVSVAAFEWGSIPVPSPPWSTAKHSVATAEAADAKSSSAEPSSPPQPWDFIVCSDLLYTPAEVHELLLASLRELTSERTVVFVSHGHRLKVCAFVLKSVLTVMMQRELTFFERLKEFGLDSEQVRVRIDRFSHLA